MRKLLILTMCYFNLNCSDPQPLVVAEKIDFQAAFLSDPNVRRFASERKIELSSSALISGEIAALYRSLRKLGLSAFKALSYDQLESEYKAHMIEFSARQLKVAAQSAVKYLPHDQMLSIIAEVIKSTNQ